MTNALNEKAFPPYLDCPKPEENTENNIELCVYKHGRTIFNEKVKAYKLTNDNGYMTLKITMYNDWINEDEETIIYGNFVVKVHKIG